MSVQISPIRCVGAIIHDADGRLLLIRRAHDPSAGLWSVPGGRVEDGESDAQAVVRELREETGLLVEPGALVGSVTRGPFEIFDYACAVVGGLLQAGDDAAEARWMSYEDYVRLDGAGELVPELTATLRDWDALPRA